MRLQVSCYSFVHELSTVLIAWKDTLICPTYPFVGKCIEQGDYFTMSAPGVRRHFDFELNVSNLDVSVVAIRRVFLGYSRLDRVIQSQSLVIAPFSLGRTCCM